MTEQTEMDAAALAAPSYQPPVPAVSNQDSGQVAALQERLKALEARLAAAAGVPAEVPRELTPEEKVRAALDRAGAGLGIEERFAEIYQHLNTLAKKAGV